MSVSASKPSSAIAMAAGRALAANHMGFANPTARIFPRREDLAAQRSAVSIAAKFSNAQLGGLKGAVIRRQRKFVYLPQ